MQTTYSYSLFGGTTSSAGTSDPNPLRYTGLISGPVMPAGLQDNSARDYSPATGQFISADPTGAAGSGTNLYQYAGSDTVDNSDPPACNGSSWQPAASSAGSPTTSAAHWTAASTPSATVSPAACWAALAAR